VSSTRVKTKIGRPRCPYCHDDIQPGGDNYACHECLAWHHTGCWHEHGACVGCGNDVVRNPMTGTSIETDPRGRDKPNVRESSRGASPGKGGCFIHDRLSPQARQDLYALHGVENASQMMSEMCDCEKAPVALVEKRKRIVRAEKGPNHLARQDEHERPPITTVDKSGHPTTWSHATKVRLQDRARQERVAVKRKGWDTFQIITYLLAFLIGLAIFITEVVIRH